MDLFFDLGDTITIKIIPVLQLVIYKKYFKILFHQYHLAGCQETAGLELSDIDT